MPSKEEIEAIERIKYNDIAKPLYCKDLTICNIEDLEIVINLAEKQQRKLEQLEAEKTKLITKLENDIKDNNFKETECLEDKGRYYYAKEILELMKGE